jgi:dynein heavy chain
MFSVDSCGDCCCVLQGLARLEELVRKVMDIVDNRVEANLQAIQSTLLVELPADRCACLPSSCAC